MSTPSAPPVVVIQREGEEVEYRSVYSVLCTTCGARVGQPCTSPSTHKTRVRLASYKPVPDERADQ